MPVTDSAGYTLFDTALGRMAMAWRGREITGIQLPDASDAALARRVRFVAGDPEIEAGDPPAFVRQAVKRLRAHLEGAHDPLDDLPLALSHVGEFREAIYRAARGVGPGRTVTYGQLAAMAGKPGAARAVGRALGCNPFPVVVPCHRVLAANAKPGGFSAPGGLDTKARLLAVEGVRLSGRQQTLSLGSR